MPTQTAQGRQSDKQTKTAKIVPQNTTNETETQKKPKTPVPVEEGPARPPADANTDDYSYANATANTFMIIPDNLLPPGPVFARDGTGSMLDWRRYNSERQARAVEEEEFLKIVKEWKEMPHLKRFKMVTLGLISIVAILYFLWNLVLLVVTAFFYTLVFLGLMQDPRQAFDTCNAMFNEEAVEAAPPVVAEAIKSIIGNPVFSQETAEVAPPVVPVVAEAIKSIVGNITEFATLDH